MGVYAEAVDAPSGGSKANRKLGAKRELTRWARAQRRTDQTMRYLFIFSAIFVSVVILSIIVFLGIQGTKTFAGTSIADFFTRSKWEPDKGSFGALSFIAGTFELTGIAIVLATPLALAGAMFMAKVAPRWMREILRPAADLFVGIPSIVYGFIAMTTIAPWLSQHYGGTGYGLLCAGLVLAVMILPTILSVAEDAFRSLPQALEEASYALGATRWQTLRRVLFPAALPGIMTAVVLGMGRALGETMAITLVIGNSPQLVRSLVKPAATLTTEIATEMGNTIYGTTWNDALFLMALVLLIISMFLILLIRLFSRRRVV